MIALLSSGLIFARRINVRETVRNIAIWVAIAAVLILGAVVPRRDRRASRCRVRSELVPGYALEFGEHEMVLTESAGGNFFIFGEANGVRVRFLIDTGASDTVLSPSDAQASGSICARSTSRECTDSERSGPRRALYARESLSVGPISVSPMPVSVNEAEMNSSLLGMTFLRRLRSFEIQGAKTDPADTDLSGS